MTDVNYDRILVANGRDALNRFEELLDERDAVPEEIEGEEITVNGPEEQYHIDAMRTAAGPEVFHVPHVPNWTSQQLMKDLVMFMIAAQDLDRWKSILFYGKVKPMRHHEVIAEFAGEMVDLDHITVNPQLIHAILGIGSEAGEMVEDLGRVLRGTLDNTDNLSRESGDIDWFQELLATATERPVSVSRQENIARLRARFPDAFSEADALARADENDTGLGGFNDTVS